VSLPEGDEKIRVVVHTRDGRSIGFVVARIVDIVEDTLNAKRPPSRSGVLFSAVIQNRVTEFLDVMGIIRNAEPGFLDDAPNAGQRGV
jgi:two-component system chemotaxis sensor kinase CheA